MKKTIVGAFIALLTLLGALALPASATMSPPNGAVIQTGNLYYSPVWAPDEHCNLYFAQGNSGGKAYAVIARPTSGAGGDCHTYIPIFYCRNTEGSGCYVVVRISYRRTNGTTGAAYTILNPETGLNQAWAIGPAGSTLLSSQIYGSSYGYTCGQFLQPIPCDPLVADSPSSGYSNWVSIMAYYNGI